MAHGVLLLLLLSSYLRSSSSHLSVASITSERRTQLAIVMCEIQDLLRKVRRLNDTADLDRTLLLNELSNRVQ